MENNLTEIFKKIMYQEPENLRDCVWSAIAARDKRMIRIKFWSFVAVTVASLSLLMPALKTLSTDISQSGFYDYFSLIFSNGGSVVTYWKELAFSLAESLPVGSIVFVLSLIFVFFLSLRYMLRQTNKEQLISRGVLQI